MSRKVAPALRRMATALTALSFCFTQARVEAQRPAHKDPTLELPRSLPPLEVRVFGQKRWLQGVPASFRIIVSDHRTGKPTPAQVEVLLIAREGTRAANSPIKVFVGPVDGNGTLSPQIDTTHIVPGRYLLRVVAWAEIGLDRLEQEITVHEDGKAQILVTTDKPLYQPGQIIHLRALVQDSVSKTPLSRAPITFEIEDGRGNKVFRETADVSRFGVASADFELADEVNMGEYAVRVLHPNARTVKKIRVDRYVVPTFTVAVATTKPYYRPGETVTGEVKATYLFGKPVAGADISLSILEVTSARRTLAEMRGRLNADGMYRFESTLPRDMGRLTNGRVEPRLAITVNVRDAAGRNRQASLQAPIVRNGLLLAVVPESPHLLPGVSNRFFVRAYAPNGSAASGVSLTIRRGAKEQATSLKTDSFGIAVYTLTPEGKNAEFAVIAKAANGDTAAYSSSKSLNIPLGAISLRPDRTLLKVGNILKLTAFASAPSKLPPSESRPGYSQRLAPRADAMVYFDLIHRGQTVHTSASRLVNRRATVSLPLTEQMSGALQINAYVIDAADRVSMDTKMVVVLATGGLTIDVRTDRAEYKPGSDATLRYAVSDARKRPVAAALGVAVVDEAVYSLSDLKPALLESSLLDLDRALELPVKERQVSGRPVFRVRGLTLRDLLSGTADELNEAPRQRAAAMLLATLNAGPTYGWQENTYLSRWTLVRAIAVEHIRKVKARIAAAVSSYCRSRDQQLLAKEGLWKLVDLAFLRPDDLIDPWGTPYSVSLMSDERPWFWSYSNRQAQLEKYRKNPNSRYSDGFDLLSAGPDRRWKTSDDVSAYSARYGLFGGGGGGLGGAGGRFGGGAMFGGMPGGRNPTYSPMGSAAGADPAPTEPDTSRVREFFPETMYWNPQIITDENGTAEVNIPVADSITTWRVSTSGSTALGQTGAVSTPLRAFQEFFVDVSLPTALTKGDWIEIPAAVYNYLDVGQTVSVSLQREPWFTPSGELTQKVTLGKGEVKAVYFPVQIDQAGSHTLTITAIGSKLSDAIKRTVEVAPSGEQREVTLSDRLSGAIERTVTFPANALPEGQELTLKLFPGAFSQVVEGLEGILRVPNGCFEQTSSAAYPNVLALQYLSRSNKASPEVKAKAEALVNTGYQKLVTFEAPGGGFSLYGRAPAGLMLTAYGLLQFAEMSQVQFVDPGLIARTQTWLANQQEQDGTWRDAGSHLLQSGASTADDTLRTTGFVAHALAESGYKGAGLPRALSYLQTHAGEATDAYTRALLLLVLAGDRSDPALGQQLTSELLANAIEADDGLFWRSERGTWSGAKEASADAETTALAAYALIKSGSNAAAADKALASVVRTRGGHGTWASTQATVWSLKALVASSGFRSARGEYTVTVSVNGEKEERVAISADQSDLLHQVNLTRLIRSGDNRIRLAVVGDTTAMFQLVARYYSAWKSEAQVDAIVPLSLRVHYASTIAALGDLRDVSVSLTNTSSRPVELPLADIGIPPAHTVAPDELDRAVLDGRISKYVLTRNRLHLYFGGMEPGKTVTIPFRMRADYPIRALTPPSTAYPYYNPERAAVVAPTKIEVHR